MQTETRPLRASLSWLAGVALAVLSPTASPQWLAPAPTSGDDPPGPAVVAPAMATPDADDGDDDVVVTASRHGERSLDLPYAVSRIEGQRFAAGAGGQDGRSLPNALTRQPSVLLQKTASGQSSPFIRGFTGFRTLWLVDGIRLNNSVWRSGPVQYSGTVDLFSVDNLELVRGPSGATWGSDAIGGTVNARTAAHEGDGRWHGLIGTRWASNEDSFQTRLGFAGGDSGSTTIRGGVTVKDFGDLRAGAGSGRLPETSYTERDADLRIDVPLGEGDGDTFTAGYQHVRQRNVPRVHRTVEAVPFHSSTVGSTLVRDHDQGRDLLYGRWAWQGRSGGLVDGGEVTLSWHQQQEDRHRVRTGGRIDASGFDVRTVGVQAQAHKELGDTRVTFGTDYYHDDVDSFHRDVVGGVPQPPSIQGPVGDDASYDLLGAYVQAEIPHGDDAETTVGLRWTQAHASAHQVDDPNVPGSSPFTPGNVIRVDESYTNLAGNLRFLQHVSDQTSLFVGLSQGFRAPNLSDLTSNLEDSGIESPSPDLDPETFLTAEVGAKTERDSWNGELVVYHTWAEDMIVRSPTGQVIAGTPVFRKDNASDGRLWGVELSTSCDLGGGVSWFGIASWQDGELDQYTAGGAEINGEWDRLMPLTATTGLRYEPEQADWWLQGDVLMADEADKLSLQNQSDTQRIPPGGTPGYAVVGLRGGVQVDESLELFAAVENLLNKDYRIHGSGQNEPGRGVVAGFLKRF